MARDNNGTPWYPAEHGGLTREEYYAQQISKVSEAAAKAEADKAAAEKKKEEEAAAAAGAKAAEQKKAYSLDTAATEAAANRQMLAAQSGTVSATQTTEAATKAQSDLIKALQAQAAGTTPSLTEAQMRATQEKNLAQQLATAGASRGGNQAALQRQLLKSQQAGAAETTQQAGTLRLQEQQAAQSQLATAIANQQSAANAAQQTYQNALSTAIAQGLTTEQAQTAANVAYQEALTQQEQFQKQQETQIEAARLSGEFQVQSSEAGAKGQSIWNLIGLKDGGVVPEKKDTEFEKALAARKSDSYKPIMAEQEKPAFAAGGEVLQPKKIFSDVPAAQLKLNPAISPLSDSKEASLLKGDTVDFTKSAADNIASSGTDWAAMGSKLGDFAVGQMASRLPPAAAKTYGLYQAGAGLAGALSAMSDKNEKKNIESDDKIQDFLSKLKAYKYEYKDPNTELTSPGPQHSVMAQDLEKSEIGQGMVDEADGGKKVVNYAKGFGAILAAQADLNRRLSELENKKGARNAKK